jgi:hypothetical protein
VNRVLGDAFYFIALLNSHDRHHAGKTAQGYTEVRRRRMAETYTGEVRNGVVVFDEGMPHPPEGMKVQVAPIDVNQSLAKLSADLRALAGSAEGLPEDLAENLDHCLHVAPVEPAHRSRTLADRYSDSIGTAEGLPSDMALEHDHYIHGMPRRSEG